MAKRRSQLDHDKMVKKIAYMLVKEGYEDVKAAHISNYPEPEEIDYPDYDEPHIPDVTGYKDYFELYEVETKDSIIEFHTEDQWSLFSTYCEENGAIFIIAVPAGYEDLADERLLELSIQAKVIGVSQ